VSKPRSVGAMAFTRTGAGGYKTLSGETHDLLRSEILSARLRPGQGVSERELCERLGVSKSTVRNALHLLSQDGLVHPIPSVGYVVAPITLEDARDICDLRNVLETAAIERAVEHMSGESLARLEKIVDESAEILGSAKGLEEASERWYLNNAEFHVAIAEAGGNPRLTALVRRAMEDTRRLVVLVIRDEDDPSIRDGVSGHQATLAALRERDAEQACAICRRDIELFVEEIDELLAADPGLGGVPPTPDRALYGAPVAALDVSSAAAR
jgi:DNA-binding GntR family transcriptional regulator